jgi:hypothetical protein
LTTKTDPIIFLGTLLRRLRRLYLMRRFIELITVAITLDLLLGVLSYITFLLFRKSFYIPFFLEVFVTILVLREITFVWLRQMSV